MRESDERAQDAREVRRKQRPLNEPQSFEELLDDAQDASHPADEPAITAQPEAQAKVELPAGSPVRNESSAKTKPLATADLIAFPLQASATDAPIAPGAANVLPLLQPTAERPRAEAEPLPAATKRVAAPAVDAAATNPGEILPAQDDAPVADPAPLASTAEPLQSAARDAAQAALAPDSRSEPAPPAPLKVTPLPPAPPAPPGDSERAGEILRQIRVQFSPELHTATIQLSPPELGRISIRMRVERGELRATVRAEKAETLAALERHVPELKATLEQLGIQARQFDLQLGFEQQGARQEPNEPRARESAPAGNEHDPRAREHERRLARTLSVRTGGIDTYA